MTISTEASSHAATVPTEGPGRLEPDLPNTVPTLHHALPAVVVHTALRREFLLAPALVRGLVRSNPHRTEVVTRHLDLLLRLLHHHHELEDELVWPLLRARAEQTVMPIVDLMEDQHAAIARLDEEATVLLARLAAGFEAADRDRLAAVLDELQLHLVDHLALEEHIVLPLAERHLHVGEWAEIGRRGDAGIPKEERALSLGMLQYEGDPQVVASMVGPVPRLVRLLVLRQARRAYRRHAIAVHGTPTP